MVYAGEAPTPYPDVNEALNTLQKDAQAVLGKYFVGLYLYGSLAGGDFTPGRSDIDFLVVTSRDLPRRVIEVLEAMHNRIWASATGWVSKLEGAYIPLSALWEYDAAGPECPMVNEKRFLVARPGIDWVINRHVLYTGGVVLSGPPLQRMIRHVEPEELREAVLSLLGNNWRSFMGNADNFAGTGYQSYAVLTMCRGLYTLEHGTVASKGASVEWATAALDSEWADLIRRAFAWRYGLPSGDVARTQAFMRYALERAGV